MAKKWIPLFATNFLGVTNNNFLKTLIIFLSVTQLGQTDKGFIVMLASGLYVMPYIIFSPLGGRLAKTQRKSNIMLWSKMAELPLFALACVGLLMHSIYIELFCIFSIGLISTLFSPSKYGLIRDIGGDGGLSFGTGTLEMFTFLGVLIGTFAASWFSDNYIPTVLFSVLISISLVQIVLCYIMKKIPETQPIEATNDTLNPLRFLVQSFKWAQNISHANIIILGLATFWMLGSLIIMNLTLHCDKVLHMTNTQTGWVMNISSIGIGLGSIFTGLMSRHKVQLGFTPIGALGMMICFATLYTMQPQGILFSVIVSLTSFFCGMFMVPLSAWVQHSVEGRLQGDMLAYSNFVIFLFILISAGLFGPVSAFFGTNTMWLAMFIIVLIVIIVMITQVKEMGSKTLVLIGIK
jgi:acyl-[acyl-carrier-protein]-phospholipid O-acyltransferase/long-chain-fatty-acid--[acyl-carrier-protein] ligase